MAEKIDQSFIKKRVDAMSENSSTYRYYLTTPLSELKSKEEKLIKKEIEARQLAVLNEDMAVAPNETEEKKRGSWKDVATGAAVGGATAGTALYLANPEIAEHTNNFLQSVGDKFKSWFTIEDQKAAASTGSDKSDSGSSSSSSDDNSKGDSNGDRSWLGDMGDSISSTFDSITARFSTWLKDITGNNNIAPGVSTMLLGVICVLTVWGVWKLIKWFVKDDGTKKPEGEPVSESNYSFAIKRNLPLAVFQEAEIEQANGANSLSGIHAIMKRFADSAIVKLLDDAKFVKFMDKENPELLKDLRDYKEANGALSEMKDQDYFMRYVTLYEAEDAALATTDEGQIDRMASTFNATPEEKTTITGKIKDIYNRIANHPNRLVRWIPPAVVGALTVLATYYFWDKFGANPAAANEKGDKKPEIPNDQRAKNDGEYVDPAAGGKYVDPADVNISANGFSEKASKPSSTYEWSILANERAANLRRNNFMSDDDATETIRKMAAAKANGESLNPSLTLFRRSLRGLDLVTEAMAKAKYASSPALDNLSGKGEVLANNIIERAKYVASDLINDEQFVKFSRQNNPEMLKTVKQFAETSKGAHRAAKKKA